MKDILWISLGLAVAVPAILVPMVSRRMLLPTAIAWLMSPVLVYAALIARDLITQPVAKNALGNALYGLALLSPILAPPWLAACLVGFALGFCLRWMTRPSRRKPRPAAATPNPHSPATPAHAEWRPVHIGFENDALSINGVDVWAHKWREQGGPKLRLAHITHPNQFHDYEVYTIGDDAKRVRFAACELSNGVWGFAVREAGLVTTQGYSHDNTLRYEHRVLPGVTGPASPTAILFDVASGQILADCGSWASSRIVSNADGSLFIRLQQNFFDVVFRVDPAKREFWNHGEGGPRRTLAELGAAIGQARQACGNANGHPAYRTISPDASIRVDLDTVEWANSHWVNSPRLVEIATGRVVLDLSQTDWDATASFPGLRRVKLDLRRYRQGGAVALEIDLKSDTYQIIPPAGSGSASAPGPLAFVRSALEAATARAAGSASAHGVAVNPWAAWRSAVLIAAAAFVAIAVATFVSMNVTSSGTTGAPLARVPFNLPH